MKDLLYFSFSDLLIKAQYSKKSNSLKYSSHRKITFGERVVIEQYLLSNFALKTEYYKRHPSMFVYMGEDESLVKELNVLHLKNTIKVLSDKDKEVKEQINDLIANSMRNYYFEQIGDGILSLREEFKESTNEKRVSELVDKIDELIKAYNQYSSQKITIEDVIPVDIKGNLEIA